MKLFRVLVLASLGLAASRAHAADATSPVDATRRNATFSPGAAIAPAIQAPQPSRLIRDERVEPAIIEKPSAAIGERRAAIEPKETRDKRVLENQSSRPATVDVPASIFNHREATLSPAAEAKVPPRVAKYQDSLTAASASNMARFPAGDLATVTKINRFVFRKNPSEPEPVTRGAAVVPAGGGGVPQK